MRFAVVPPPVTLEPLLRCDAKSQARAVVGGYGCARCAVGLREPGELVCIRCLTHDDDAEFRRCVTDAARDVRQTRWS